MAILTSVWSVGGAQRAGHDSTKYLEAVRVAEGPLLDGDMSDAAWLSAEPISDFLQQEPVEGGEPSEKTEVRVLFTDEALYVGFWAYDSNIAGIVANERRRDQDMAGDDAFWFVIDTFHSHRDAYFFKLNPLGNRWDALITDESSPNEEWDGRWDARCQIHSWGWAAEVRIPLSTLRFPNAPDPLWGIDFKRWIRRKNEAMAWSLYRRDFRFAEVSQAGHMGGLSSLPANRSLQVKPYVAGQILRSQRDEVSQDQEDVDAGLENLRYTLTSRLKLDATVNPDFGQAEVDELIVNLTRFSLFFEEKRDFFLEDAGLFDFSLRSSGFRRPPDLTLLHTRRIGLTDRRAPIPILFGSRLTGQLSGMSLGVMNVQVREQDETPAENVGAYRFKKDLFSRSYVGAMATHLVGDLGDNGTVGVDSQFTFFENLRIRSFLVKSESTGEEGEGWAALPLWIDWDSDRYQAGVQHFIVQEGFDPAVGFVGREGIEKSTASLAYRPRPAAEWVRQMQFRGNLEYIADPDGTLLTRDQSVSFQLDLAREDSFEVEFNQNLERQDEPFELADRLAVDAGIYRNNELSVQFVPYDGRRVSGFFGVSRDDFWGGKKTSLNLSPNIKWSDQFLTDFDLDYEKVELPQGEFTSLVLNSRFDLAWTNRWLTTLTVQYNDLDEEWGFNFRLNYIYRPGDDFFLVINRTKTLEQRDWSILAKLTHTFEF